MCITEIDAYQCKCFNVTYDITIYGKYTRRNATFQENKIASLRARASQWLKIEYILSNEY